MSSYQDITLPAGQWVNVTSTVGAAVGDTLIVQNLNATDVRIDERLNEPPSADYGWLLSLEKGATSVPVQPANSVWALAVSKPATLHVEEGAS